MNYILKFFKNLLKRIDNLYFEIYCTNGFLEYFTITTIFIGLFYIVYIISYASVNIIKYLFL